LNCDIRKTAEPLSDNNNEKLDMLNLNIAILKSIFGYVLEKEQKMIKHIDNLDADEIQSNRLLLRSRIKLGVGIVLGLLLGYLAYRFLTSSSGELSQETQETIKPEVPPPLPLPAADMDMDMNDMPDLPNTTR
jgi:hypothetical protein